MEGASYGSAWALGPARPPVTLIGGGLCYGSLAQGLGFVAIVRVFLLLLNDRFVLSVVMAP